MTTFSVIINTFNRKDKLEPLLEMIRGQTLADFEVIVADDGSTDGTDELIRDIADDQVRYVRQENAGLGAARNLGARSALGDYLVWLDDDDEVSENWLESFAEAGIDEGPAVACVGARMVDETGTVVETRLPTDLGPAFDHHVGLFLSGTFAVTRNAFDGVGGFTAGLQCSHQTELALRLLPRCSEEGWEVRHSNAVVLTVHRAAASDRGRNQAEKLLGCTAWIIREHGARLALDPPMLASYCAIAGVCTARLGDHRDARRWFGRAVRARPSDPKMIARWSVASIPPVARRVWRTQRVQSESPESS